MPKTIDAIEKAYNLAVHGALLALEGNLLHSSKTGSTETAVHITLSWLATK